MLTIREIDNLNELAQIRSAWNALLAQTPGATFFQSYDWLAAFWTHCAGGQTLRVLVAEDRGLVRGIVPLVVRRERRRLGTLRVLGYPLDNWGTLYGPISPDPRATLTAALEYVALHPRDWDLLELRWVDTDNDDDRRTASAFAAAGLTAAEEPWQCRAIVALDQFSGWNDYWMSRSGRWRSNIRRAEKKLAAGGRVEHVRYRPAGLLAGRCDPEWELYAACEQIARASWQAHSTNGTTLSHEAIRPFLADCHCRAAASGALDMNLLLVGGRPVAFNYAYHYQGRVTGLRTGYDRTLTCDGAGSVLQARMIEDSFARGDTSYDLGADYLNAKRYWLTETRDTVRFTHFPPRAARAQLVRWKRGVERWLART